MVIKLFASNYARSIEQVFDGIRVGTREHQHAPFMDILLCTHFCIHSNTPDLLG